MEFLEFEVTGLLSYYVIRFMKSKKYKMSNVKSEICDCIFQEPS
jgi:hypothetical protein